MKKISGAGLFVFATLCLFSCNSPEEDKKEATVVENGSAPMADSAAIKEQPLTVSANGTNLNCYAVFDSSTTAKRPVVLVVPEWWGLTEYPRMRAKKLAQLGYLAVVVDMYGDGKIAPTPQEAKALATPFYENPNMGMSRMKAVAAKAFTLDRADTTKVAAIGYCFGGTMVLNAAKMGAAYDGVVSFHGGLEGVPAKKELLKSRMLVAHGGDDSFVPQTQVDAFRKSLDSIGASYTFKVYPGATHAFTNPNATAMGEKFKMPIRYNAAADSASWEDMKAFFREIFK